MKKTKRYQKSILKSLQDYAKITAPTINMLSLLVFVTTIFLYLFIVLITFIVAY